MEDIINKKEKDDSDNTPKDNPKNEDQDSNTGKEEKTDTETTTTESQKDAVLWRNYKFIPGEKVIFYDDLKFEEVGEFPSRWDLRKGGSEIATLNGEKMIISTADYDNTIFPLFDTENYLSDEFTIEFDIYVDELSSTFNNSTVDYNIFLSKKNLENHSNSIADIEFELSSNKVYGYVGEYDFSLESVSISPLKAWHHISLSYNKGKFKMYYDEKRIANIPKLKIVPDMFGIQMHVSTDGKFTKRKINHGIKNIRIAHGGGQMYKRIIANSKYVTNGILFDSGKAIIKPQSQGIINKIATVMNENPDWNFQIIGHTDSDGDTDKNLKLSKQRAESVKQALVAKGIKTKRLSTLGKGESEPLNTNNSPEEKANNRRVEFIKK